MQAPITVLQANTKRDIGRKAQLGNIMAGKVGLFIRLWVYIFCTMHGETCMQKKDGRDVIYFCMMARTWSKC